MATLCPDLQGCLSAPANLQLWPGEDAGVKEGGSKEEREGTEKREGAAADQQSLRKSAPTIQMYWAYSYLGIRLLLD